VPYLRDLAELVSRAADTFGGRIAFRELVAGKTVRDHSYLEVRDDVAALATALFDVGLAGRHVALVGDSTYSYVVSYLAVVGTGGVVIPLDKELTNAELAELIDRSEAEAVCFGDSMRGDIAAIRSGCPRARVAIDIGNTPQLGNPWFDELLERGRRLLAAGDTRHAEVEADPEALCTILFTSGTTGPSKGVMLSQRNIVTTIHSAFAMSRYPHNGFSVLPINHAYEFNLNILGSLFHGITLCFNDSIMHVAENLQRFRPEMSLMVPMIVEALHKNIWKEAEKNHMTGYLRYAVALSSALWRIGIDLRRHFFRPIHQHFGGRFHMIVCGGAPLAAETAAGLTALGIDVYNGYGITECSPLISSNCTLRRVDGSVGIPCPDIEVRIDAPDAEGIGEIQVRGPAVMLGYYADPEATRAAFTDDGWFHTGDLGRIGRRGALFVTGREKNLIILPNGKNVQPEEIEQALLVGIEYLREVVVHESFDAAGAPRIAASAYLDPEWVSRLGSDDARLRFEADVAAVNERLASYKRICLTRLREQEFEKTATRKIMRHRIEGVPA
jgi:long-chain acyl-CoA synthetase